MAPTIDLHGLHGSPLAPHIAGFEAFLNFQIFGVFVIELRQRLTANHLVSLRDIDDLFMTLLAYTILPQSLL